MKKFLSVAVLSLAAVVAAPFFTSNAQALVFSDTIDFVGDFAPTYGYTYFRVFDNAGFSWTHNINGDLGGNSLGDVILSSAILNVTFANTNDDPQEHWGLTGFGPLVTALGNAPKQLSFVLNPSQLGDLAADGLFNVKPFEITSSLDRFRLIEARLSGDFALSSHMPEPTTLLLMTSVLGAAFLRRVKAT